METDETEDSTNDNSQLIEIKDRSLSNDEHMLPVHFLPEGRQCYDWIKNDIKINKEKIDDISYSYAKQLQSPEHKMKTKAIDSITYSSCNIDTSIGISPAKDTLSILLKSAEEGNLDSLKDILKKCPTLINLTDSDGYTALHRASYSGHENTLLYLLEHGANVNAKTHDGWQPIHCATRWNNLNVCKILLEHQADINASTKGLQTPLHFAALSQDSCNILEMLLLNTNININVTNAAGDTPYDLAYRNGPQVQLFDLVDKGLKI